MFVTKPLHIYELFCSILEFVHIFFGSMQIFHKVRRLYRCYIMYHTQVEGKECPRIRKKKIRGNFTVSRLLIYSVISELKKPDTTHRDCVFFLLFPKNQFSSHGNQLSIMRLYNTNTRNIRIDCEAT